MSDLKAGNRQLIRVLNSHQLSGSAFTAGQGLFTQLVIPTVSKADTVIQKLNSKLQQYGQYTGAAGGEILDEDKLNQQLEALRRQQATLSSQIRVYQNQARSSEEADITAMCYSYASSLTNFMGTVQEDIRQVEEKLKKLHELDMKLAPLFSGITSELSNLSAVISAIGSGNFDQSGNFKGGGNKNIKALVKILSDYDSGDLPTEIGKSVLEQGVVSKAVKEVGQHYKIKGIKQGSRSVSPNSMSRVGKNARAVESLGDDIIKTSKSLASSKVWETAGAIGAVVSVGLDYDEQMTKYNDVGRAAKNTGAHIGVGMAGSVAGTAFGSFAVGYLSGSQVGAAIGTLIPVPVVGTVVGAVVGAGIGYLGNKAYDWVESGEAGKFVDKSVKNISKGFNSFKNTAGEMFSGFGKSLGSVFG